MNKKQLQAVEKAITRRNEARDARLPKENLWRECYEIYRAYRKERKDGKSNLFIPYLFGLVETVTPRITDTIFAKEPCLTALPMEPQDIEGAEANEILMDYQFRKARFKEKVTEWVKQSAIYGTGFVKVYWDRQVETKIVEERNIFSDPLELFKMLSKMGNDTSSIRKKEKEIVKYEGANIEVLDIMEVYIDPYTDTVENARYAVHETMRTEDYVKERIKNKTYDGVTMKDWDNIKDSAGGQEYNDFSVLQRQQHIGMANDPRKSEGMIKITEYWEKNRVITVANDTILLRDKENPFNHKKIPIVEVVDTKSIKELYGIGEIEPNRYLQSELNTNRNQRIENVKMAINNSYFYDETAIDEEDFVDAPNAKIPIRNRGQRTLKDILYPVPKQPIHSSAYTEEEVIKRDMQETSGVTKYVRGVEPTGSATATEITSLQREANYRFKQKIRNVANALEKVGEMWVALNQQFITENQFIRISGDKANQLKYMQPETYNSPVMEQSNFKFLQIDPESIAGEYDIKVATSALEPLADKQIKRQQLLQAFQITSQNGLSLPSLFKEILKTFDDLAVMDKVIMEYEQQMLQQQQINQLKFQAQNKGNPQQQQIPQRVNNPMGMVNGQ